MKSLPVICVAGNSIETPRLLLLSASKSTRWLKISGRLGRGKTVLADAVSVMRHVFFESAQELE